MRVGIAGYGNIARSLECMIGQSDEMEVVGVFTRRSPDEVQTCGAAVYHFADISAFEGEIDVMFLCMGSSSDLPRYGPLLAERFDTVDTYDNHRTAEAYKASMDRAAREGAHVSIVSLGWDPGFLSLIRLYCHAFLPSASVNTFWGRGVSQGHGEALRRIDGVKNAIQYTVPREDALTLAGLVAHPLDDCDRHRRVCYVVADKGKEERIRGEILSMENYFLGYETEIHFITEDEFMRYHVSSSHRGRIYALGSSGKHKEVKHGVYFDIDMGSNPDLTASIMLSGARAISKIKKDGGQGAYSPFDIPPSYFAPNKCENVNNYL